MKWILSVCFVVVILHNSHGQTPTPNPDAPMDCYVPKLPVPLDCDLPTLISTAVVRAAAFYFSKNPIPDEPFKTINIDFTWTAVSLFQHYYDDDSSTALFISAILDIQEAKLEANKTLTEIVELIAVREFRDARIALASVLANEIPDVESCAELQIRWNVILETICVVAENDNCASFLNLKLGSSLSFVMDTTGSMAGEIAAAKSRVIDIINSTINTNSAPLNYVLVPFNDPSVGPVTKTENPDDFIAAVNTLSANGGGDIPELAMEGILLAAQNSAFRSLVYVFTDAPEKDTELQSQVIALSVIKKISVYIFLTNNIDRRKRALATGRPLYDFISEQTGGQVVVVRKEDVSAATELLKATTVQGQAAICPRPYGLVWQNTTLVLLSQGQGLPELKLVLLNFVTDSTANSLSFQVDGSVQSLLILLVGEFEFVSLQVTTPRGSHTGTVTPTVLADIDGVYLIRVDSAETGRYQLNLIATKYSVTIRGESTLGFHAHLEQGECTGDQQLRAGVATTTHIAMYGRVKDVVVTEFRLVSRTGDVLLRKNVTNCMECTSFNVDDEFDLPGVPMLVEISGRRNGIPFRRVDPCAVSPVNSRSFFEPINDVTIAAGGFLTVKVKLQNKGSTDTFSFFVTDNRNYVTLDVNSSIVAANGSAELVLTAQVPSNAENGVLSKVVLTASAANGGYFLFTTFVVNVVDNVVRCAILPSPVGGSVTCSPDGITIGSVCRVTCGSEYELNGMSSRTCLADGTWSNNLGSCRFLGSSFCRLQGDPHYVTFDRRRYDFMGACLYNLVTTNVTYNGSLVPIKISAENVQLARRPVSAFKQGFVTVYGITVHFKRGGIILIDGVKTNLPTFLNDGRLRIEIRGSQVRLSTDFKMIVTYDGRTNFRITLPAIYMNKVSGLCGNYNSDPSDDVGDDIAATGNSFELIGGSDPRCRKGNASDSTTICTNEALRAIIADKCAIILGDCFDACLTDEVKQTLFNACLFDMCALAGSDGALEDALATIDTFCAQNGSDTCDWRIQLDLPKTCPENSVFQPRGNQCPDSCTDPRASERCLDKPFVPTCACNDGFVLSDKECVPVSQCGCTISKYFKKGETYIEEGCTRSCTCIGGNVIRCVAMSCEEGNECQLDANGLYRCQPSGVATCSATGDPHYRMFNTHKSYDFMGSCSYVMVKTHLLSTDDSKYLIVVTKNDRRGSSRVSYVQSVRIWTNAGLVQFGPGKNVETNITSDDKLQILKSGRFNELITVHGVNIKFDGTNLYISLPTIYMNEVQGLCGNYSEKGFVPFANAAAITDFAMKHKYGNECVEDVIEEVVCSEEDKEKWRGDGFCGILMHETFSACQALVDRSTSMENCVFDMCATDGDMVVLRKSLEDYAEQCPGIVCDWELDTGMAPSCPAKSSYKGCASVCQDTCQNLDAEAKCESVRTEPKCICDFGFVLSEGECVEKFECGCTIDGKYIGKGERLVRSCSEVLECRGANSVIRMVEGCGDFATCKGNTSVGFECVPKQNPYVLVYENNNIKTFDNKHYSFFGDCAYTVVRHFAVADRPGRVFIPNFKIVAINEYDKLSGLTYIKDVHIYVWNYRTHRNDGIYLKQNGDILLNGRKVSAGSKKRDMSFFKSPGIYVTAHFAFNMEVRFGLRRLYVAVSPNAMKRVTGLGGNFNGNDDDEFSILEGLKPLIESEYPKKMSSFKIHEFAKIFEQKKLSEQSCSTKAAPECSSKTLRERYERSCDCGVLRDESGPFANCIETISPEPYFKACVRDACNTYGNLYTITNTVEAYAFACDKFGIKLGGWRDAIKLPTPTCPKFSNYSTCADICQPSCSSSVSDCKTLLGNTCSEGCACDPGYILSGDKCVLPDACGCFYEGEYFENGICVFDVNCTTEWSCIRGDWVPENKTCYDDQWCGFKNGFHGCHPFDECEYENGGCSHICISTNSSAVCSCSPGYFLDLDMKTCRKIPQSFFSQDTSVCGTIFNVWKSDFIAWKTEYVPQWLEELDQYKSAVERGNFSPRAAEAQCVVSWTGWYNRDDPNGCGDEETLDLLRRDFPGEICKKPLAVEARLAEGSEQDPISAIVTRNAVIGLLCKNADQPTGTRCPDLAVRFLCLVDPMKAKTDTEF